VRAATQVDPSDLRPTGPPRLSHATHAWQRQLDMRLAKAPAETGNGGNFLPQMSPAPRRTPLWRSLWKG
jgi:hypothetical protein